MRPGTFVVGLVLGAVLGSAVTVFILRSDSPTRAAPKQIDAAIGRVVTETTRPSAPLQTPALAPNAGPEERQLTATARPHVGVVETSFAALMQELRRQARRPTQDGRAMTEIVGDMHARFPDTLIPWAIVADLHDSATTRHLGTSRDAICRDRSRALAEILATYGRAPCLDMLEQAVSPQPSPHARRVAQLAVRQLAENGGVPVATALRMLQHQDPELSSLGVQAIAASDGADVATLVELSDTHTLAHIRRHARRALAELATQGRAGEPGNVDSTLIRAARDETHTWNRRDALDLLKERGDAGVAVALEAFEAGGLAWESYDSVAVILLRAGQGAMALERNPTVGGLEILTAGLGSPYGIAVDGDAAAVATVTRTFVRPVLERHVDLVERLGADQFTRLLDWAARTSARDALAAIVLHVERSSTLRYAALETLVAHDESAADGYDLALRLLTERAEPADMRILAVEVLGGGYADAPETGGPSEDAMKAALRDAAANDSNAWVRAAALDELED